MWWRGHLYVNVREQTLYHLQFVFTESPNFVFIRETIIRNFLSSNGREKSRKKHSAWTAKFEIHFLIFWTREFSLARYLIDSNLFYWLNCPWTFLVSIHIGTFGWRNWWKYVQKKRERERARGSEDVHQFFLLLQQLVISCTRCWQHVLVSIDGRSALHKVQRQKSRIDRSELNRMDKKIHTGGRKRERRN